MYKGRTPEPLFAAIGGLIREGHIKESDVRIKLVGDCGFIDGIPTMSVAKRASWSGRRGRNPRCGSSRRGRSDYAEFHLLLVISPELHRLIVPAKLYDYLGAGSRWLLAEPGATTDLIQETGSGECFSLSDVAGLRSHVHWSHHDGKRRLDAQCGVASAFQQPRNDGAIRPRVDGGLRTMMSWLLMMFWVSVTGIAYAYIVFPALAVFACAVKKGRFGTPLSRPATMVR